MLVNADPSITRHYNRFRYYDPSVGRYVSADPIGQAGGVNVFGYALNNPMAFIDPLGLAGLTPEQCAKLREILEFEKNYGADAAAKKYSDWGSRSLSPELGPNIGVDSTAGEVDLDWYADIRTWNLGIPALSDPVYRLGKWIWNESKKRIDEPSVEGHTDPYEDPKEKRLLDAMKGGKQSFSDFFTPEFMAENCGDEPCE